MMYRIFIGWDPNEIEAYHVLCHSLIRHATAPLSITPLKKEHLPLWRERHPQQSTEFSFSRFLVPHLCDYEGQALFIDCDMMVTQDVTKLFQANSDRYAVSVVKHPEYTPKDDIKFLNQQQSVYSRKNWSSVMLFNNSQCRELTPHAVNTWSGLDLHRFTWLHDSQIGELPAEWGHLIGEYPDPPELPALLHWTVGGPWFDSYRNTAYANLWRSERKLAHGGR